MPALSTTSSIRVASASDSASRQTKEWWARPLLHRARSISLALRDQSFPTPRSPSRRGIVKRCGSGHGASTVRFPGSAQPFVGHRFLRFPLTPKLRWVTIRRDHQGGIAVRLSLPLAASLVPTAALISVSVLAATITVNSTADNTIAGGCVPSSGGHSVRLIFPFRFRRLRDCSQ